METNYFHDVFFFFLVVFLWLHARTHIHTRTHKYVNAFVLVTLENFRPVEVENNVMNFQRPVS